MDLNDMRSAVTVLLLLVFIGIVVWSWQAKRRAAFDEAAQLPFIEPEADGQAQARSQGAKQ